MKNLLEALAIPPVSCVVLIVAGLWLSGRRRRVRLSLGRPVGRALAWAGVIALLLLGTPAVSSTMLAALESGLPTTPPADQPPRAIIVLGADVIRTPDDPLGVRPGLLTLDRLRTAAALYRRTGLPILVSGGTTQHDTAPVALVMQRSLTEDFRVPTAWVEQKSYDTWENARFSAAILRPLGITSVYVVTHAWHMRRALLAFRGTGLVVTAAPTPRDNMPTPDPGDFMPRAGGWQTGYYALHEWIGYVWYSLR